MHDAFDAGQKAEAAFIASQPSAWVNMTRRRRWVTAVAVATVCGLIVGAITALADGPWLLMGLLAFAFFGVCLLPSVVAPARTIAWSVRASRPTAKAMKRGEKNRSWPG